LHIVSYILFATGTPPLCLTARQHERAELPMGGGKTTCSLYT